LWLPIPRWCAGRRRVRRPRPTTNRGASDDRRLYSRERGSHGPPLGHRVHAVGQGAEYYSWGESASRTWFDDFTTSESKWPGGIVARIPIPTKQDGNPFLNIDESKVKVDATPRGYDNCANLVHTLLQQCGASAYDADAGSFYMLPNSLADHALAIRAGVMRRWGKGALRWPGSREASALTPFFLGDPHAYTARDSRVTLTALQTDAQVFDRAPFGVVKDARQEPRRQPVVPMVNPLVANLRW
jgi:hypothetical protein